MRSVARGNFRIYNDQCTGEISLKGARLLNSITNKASLVKANSVSPCTFQLEANTRKLIGELIFC